MTSQILKFEFFFSAVSTGTGAVSTRGCWEGESWATSGVPGLKTEEVNHMMPYYAVRVSRQPDMVSRIREVTCYDVFLPCAFHDGATLGIFSKTSKLTDYKRLAIFTICFDMLLLYGVQASYVFYHFCYFNHHAIFFTADFIVTLVYFKFSFCTLFLCYFAIFATLLLFWFNIIVCYSFPPACMLVCYFC